MNNTLYTQQDSDNFTAIELRLKKQRNALLRLSGDALLDLNRLDHSARIYTHLCAETLDLERASIWSRDVGSAGFECVDFYQSSMQLHSYPRPHLLLNSTDYLSILTQDGLLTSGGEHSPAAIRYQLGNYLSTESIDSLLHVGIRNRGQLTGIICLEHKGLAREWLADEMMFACNIVDRFALTRLNEASLQQRPANPADDHRYQQLFTNSEVSIWELDFSSLADRLDGLRSQGVVDIRHYLKDNRQKTKDLIQLIRIVGVNPASLRLYEASSYEQMLTGVDHVFANDNYASFIDQICAIWNGEKSFRAECSQLTFKGREISVIMSMPIPSQRKDFAHIPVSFVDLNHSIQVQQDLLKIAHGIAPETGDDFFLSMVRSLCETLDVDIALIGKLLEGPEEMIQTVAVYADGRIADNFVYSLKDTPCKQVTCQMACTISNNIQQQFPKDTLLQEMDIEAYSGVPLKNAEGKVLGLMVVLKRSELLRAEQFESVLHLFSSRAAAELDRMQTGEHLNKLSLAVKHSPNVVLITDLAGKIEYVNPKFTEITGYSHADAFGKSPSFLKSGDTDDATYKILWRTILAGGEWRGELQNRRKSGESYWVREVIAPIRNPQGNITHFVAIQEDITDSRRISREISYQASHDMLTGLINRYEFERRLKRVVTTAQEEKNQHVLCFLDLDQFKIVNDSSGHIAGDELLREISVLLGQHLRQRDTLARIGGDEFAILMEHCGIEQARVTVEALRKLVEDYRFQWEGSGFTIGVSIGMTLIDDSSSNSTEVLKQADIACYAAKDGGRNRVHVYLSDDADLVKKEGEFLWVNEIRRALDEDRFCLYVQPIVPLSQQSNLKSYEILLRLITADGKINPPGSFLPAAERYNISQHIDKWVISHVFAWILQHPEVMCGVARFAVNLSGQSLGDSNFLQYIIDTMAEHDDLAQKISFEITETAAISNLRDATQFITSLKQYGCKFALDDFGSGLSSFAYLKNLPVDFLKIDGMFVKNILHDPLDEAMVESINHIGHVMSMTTIGEFVENEAIQQRLKQIGVDYGQGYGIGRPIPIEQLL